MGYAESVRSLLAGGPVEVFYFTEQEIFRMLLNDS